MGGNANSGKKTELARKPYRFWIDLKIEYLKSDVNEVKEFLESKGVTANEYTYKLTAGWRKEKQKGFARAMQKAQDLAVKQASENLQSKIIRRAKWWRTVQTAIMRQFTRIVIRADGTRETVLVDTLTPEQIFFLTKSLAEAIKGERLEDGQPTVVEKLDQVNLQSLKFDEMPDAEFAQIEDDFARALGSLQEPDPDANIIIAPQDQAPSVTPRGDESEALSPPLLSGPETS